MVDFDLEKFPDMALLRAHIHRLIHRKGMGQRQIQNQGGGASDQTSDGPGAGRFGAVCANGKTAYRLRIWTGLQYYDTFATVLRNGSYPMEQIMALPPADRGRLTKILTAEIDGYPGGPIFPVTSCFGGMAVSPPPPP